MCDLYAFTDISWLHFAKRKSEMAKFVSNLLGILKGKGIKVEYIRCENSGKHMSKISKLCQKEGIELEYTYPGSTIQNGQVEKKINLIKERATKMMVHAKINK